MKLEEHLNLLAKIPFQYKTKILRILYQILDEHTEEIKALGIDKFIEKSVIRSDPIIQPIKKWKKRVKK